MSSSDISVADHVRVNATMCITIKDTWPLYCMRCEVEGCETSHFHNFNIYMKHWRKFHCKEINVYECPVASCSRQFNFKWRVKPHLKNEHHAPNNASVYEKNACKRMPNMYYKDPGNTTHRKFVKVNVSAREESAVTRGRYAEHHKIYFPHLQDGGDNQVYCGTYLDIDFNNTTSLVNGSVCAMDLTNYDVSFCF